jgi:hypothetical protein
MVWMLSLRKDWRTVSEPTTTLYGDINGMDTLEWTSNGADATLRIDPTDSRVAILVILDGYDTAAVEIGREQADLICKMLTESREQI